MMRRHCLRLVPLALLGMSGCAEVSNLQAIAHPSVAPSSQPAATLKVDASQITPMYDHRLLGVDLPTVVGVTMSRNIDIQEAQQRVAASRGQYEASVGMIFPSLTPNLHFARPSRGAVNVNWLGAGDIHTHLSCWRGPMGHQSGPSGL